MKMFFLFSFFNHGSCTRIFRLIRVKNNMVMYTWKHIIYGNSLVEIMRLTLRQSRIVPEKNNYSCVLRCYVWFASGKLLIIFANESLQEQKNARNSMVYGNKKKRAVSLTHNCRTGLFYSPRGNSARHQTIE